jgi:hypothetical protein
MHGPKRGTDVLLKFLKNSGAKLHHSFEESHKTRTKFVS